VADDTFAGLWIKTGMAELDVLPPAHQTIRGKAPDRTDGMHLPLLSIGGEGPQGETSAQLVLLDMLGKGGMGVVHAARQPSLDREVAVKRVRDGAPRSAARSLLEEARIMGSLEHPNIIPVHALGTDAHANPILVMKRIGGAEWGTLMRDDAHPAWEGWRGLMSDPIARHLEILVAVCRAVQFAHERGVVHRDIKPENVMVGAGGDVYLLDWGIARRLDRARRREVVGTPSYLAPEMVDPDGELTPRTDVFLLGACLYEALAGRPPYSGATLYEVMDAAHRCDWGPLPDDVPTGLRSMVAKAMSANPGQRYASAEAMRVEIVDWMRNRGASHLLAAADEELRTLRGLLEEGRDHVDVASAFARCRFAYQQALQAADSTQARGGLIQALEVMSTFEIAQDNLVYASTLVVEMADLGADTSSLEGRLAHARRAADERRALHEDLDIRQGELERVWVIVAIGVVGTIVTAMLFGGVVWDLRDLRHEDAVSLMAVVWVGTAASIAFFRKRLMANSASIAISSALILVPSASLVSRCLGWAFETPIPHILATDMLMMALVAAILTPLVGRFVLPIALSSVGAALAIALWPDLTSEIFTVSLVLSWGGAGLWWWGGRGRVDGSE